MSDLGSTRARPARVVLQGQYARLEPLSARHARDLYAVSSDPGAAERYAFLAEHPPTNLGQMVAWTSQMANSDDPLVFAVIDKATGRAGGRQSLMRIVPEHGVAEIGGIYWGPTISQTRVATEAFFLLANYVFEDLGYRRLEWKCNALNEASKRAALRFGFTPEGYFRQHMIVKGRSRDTSWFGMIDSEWPRHRAHFERWLNPDNFDETGVQRQRLTVFIPPEPVPPPPPQAPPPVAPLPPIAAPDFLAGLTGGPPLEPV